MRHVDRHLLEGEFVVAIGRRHWIIYGRAILILIAAAVVAILGLALADDPAPYEWTALVVALVGLGFAARAWFDQFITEMAVTNIRVIYKRGFITRRTVEMNLSEVETVTVDQSIPGRIFGYGTVHARGTGQGLEHLHLVARPFAFRAAIDERRSRAPAPATLSGR